MAILRKLVLSLLALPLVLNGLWVICRDVPPQPQAPEAVQSQSTAAEQKADADEKAECERLCARQTSVCLTSPGDKTSITIVVFGVAIPSNDPQMSLPAMSREPLPHSRDFHSDPSISHPSPPPEA